MTGRVGSGGRGPRTSSPAPSSGDLPAWARRHLHESAGPHDDPDDLDAARVGRHRIGRARRRGDDGVLRGWGVAAAAVAAAVGVVPVAWSTLQRDDTAVPRVGTFPVVAPADIGEPAGAPTARSPQAAELADVLPPVESRVLPSTVRRPLPRADDDPVLVAEPPPRAARPTPPPARSAAPPVSRSTPTRTSPTSPTSPTPTDVRESEGPDSPPERPRADPEDDGGLVTDLVGGVTGLLGG